MFSSFLFLLGGGGSKEQKTKARIFLSAKPRKSFEGKKVQKSKGIPGHK